MAKRKNTVDYKNISIKDLINNPTLAKKAIAAANARITRLNKSEFADVSREMERFNKLVFDTRNKIYPTKYNVKMFTKSDRFSYSNKGYSQHQTEMKYSQVLQVLRNDYFTVPALKNLYKQQAVKLGTTLDKYMKDKHFWKSFRELHESTKYGSDEIFNVVRSLESKSVDYDEIVSIGKQLLEKAYSPVNTDVKAGWVSFTQQEFKDMLNKTPDYTRGR